MWALPVVFLRFCWKLACGLLPPMSYFKACFEGKLLFSKLQLSQCVAENVRKRDALLEASTYLSVAGLIKNGSSNQKNK